MNRLTALQIGHGIDAFPPMHAVHAARDHLVTSAARIRPSHRQIRPACRGDKRMGLYGAAWA